ncbi:MAG: energy transducer TonB [Roseateles depolymerans]|uniref:Energy transducer TonB n=1 Tax=Roseateles depolymerans TaxID=76731 RepID=A0A2W5DLN8_9BURK|nr:MAG: energy transducer TonB [Roseateles depolymerans]
MAAIVNPSFALDPYTDLPDPSPQRAPGASKAGPAHDPLNEVPVVESISWNPHSPRRRGWLVAIGVAHLAVGWGVAHSMLHTPAKPKPTPVEVRLIAPPPPPPQPTVAPPKVEIQMPLLAPMPLVPPPPVAVVTPLAVSAEAPPSPAVAPRVEATVAVATAPAPAVAPSVRELPAGSVRYLSEPRLHLPRMSRRLGEAGTVLLHIAVDASGQLKSATVKKSSGFERLDQQALIDIRTARFEPYLEKGQPVEWTADAGLQYELR